MTCDLKLETVDNDKPPRRGNRRERLKNLENDIRKEKKNRKANKTSTTLLFNFVCIISATIVMIIVYVERRPSTSNEIARNEEPKESGGVACGKLFGVVDNGIVNFPMGLL